MARSLFWLVKFARENPTSEWVDVPNNAPRWLVRTNQMPTLAWWELIERNDSKDASKKHSGFWRPTQKGFDFVDGKINVPLRVYTYNGDVEGFSDELVTFTKAFDSPGFNYAQTMSSDVPPPSED